MSEPHASARNQTRRFYDRISRAYDLIADSSEHAARDLGIRALALTPGERVLEIGCGTGHGLVSLAAAVGDTGEVAGVDISGGMMAVARERIESAALRQVTLSIGDASALSFTSQAFDAAFMSFTLELFDSAIPDVLTEVRRVLRVGGRLGIVAMAETDHTNAMIDLYGWLHRHWPHVVDCSPIDVGGVMRAAHFQTAIIETATIWSLPVVAAIGVKSPLGEQVVPVAPRS